MTKSYYAGVYWPGRKESVEECARRTEVFFRLLSRCDPMYARWFEQADSLEEALQLQFEPSYETFVRFFGSKENQIGHDGFHIGAWTGHEEDGRGSRVSLTCGDASNVFPNSCLLYLPYEEPEAERVLTVPVLTEVLRAMVLAWEPDWGIVTPRDLQDALRQKEDEREPVGWLTYFSPRRGSVPPLPEPVRIESVEDKGTLVILTPERLSANNAGHLALSRRVQEALDEKNLLRPVLS